MPAIEAACKEIVQIESFQQVKIEEKKFLAAFSKEPGLRSSEDQKFLINTWKEILNFCEHHLPDPEWHLAIGLHDRAYYDEARNLFVLTPSNEEFSKFRKLLVEPVYRHTIEWAIYEMTSKHINWTIMIEDVIDWSNNK